VSTLHPGSIQRNALIRFTSVTHINRSNQQSCWKITIEFHKCGVCLVDNPDFYDPTDVGDPVGSILLVPGHGEGDISVQHVGLVVKILVFPGETQYLFRGVASLPTRSSHNHILGGRTDGHRDSLVDVDLVCGDGDVHVHVSDDTVANSPVALLVSLGGC